MSQEPTKLVGINLTGVLFSRTAELEAIMKLKGQGIGNKGEWNMATAFIPIAWEEAISRYKADGKPGFILVDEDNIWWIAKAELDFKSVISRAADEAIAAITEMLGGYQPAEEAVIIRRTKDTLEPLLVRNGGQVDTPGVFANKPLVIKAAENLKMPDDIITRQEQFGNGVRYYFSHKKLGELGRLTVSGFDAGRAKFNAEIAQSATNNTPLVTQKREIFEQIIQFLEQSLDASLKASQ